ncbi:MAG: DNA repair protein RecO [Proteobacteria bacterium]|nr:DNA repair protein RecO [Pseudomonadota bacterium]
MRVKLQPAFILHSRPYRDSSQILDVLTAEYGRITMVVKGSRRRQRGGSTAAILQPFIPLLLSFSGRSEMKTVTASEVAGSPRTPGGARLFSGLYLNELLVRLLHRHDPHAELFLAYGNALEALKNEEAVGEVLRRFEFTLLRELGFGFELSSDGRSGQAICTDLMYRFDSEYGLVLADRAVAAGNPVFAGGDLLAMAAGEWGEPVKRTAKRLLRQALAGHLGDAPLKSRDLFRRV